MESLYIWLTLHSRKVGGILFHLSDFLWHKKTLRHIAMMDSKTGSLKTTESLSSSNWHQLSHCELLGRLVASETEWSVSVFECCDESNYKKMTTKCQETVLMTLLSSWLVLIALHGAPLQYFQNFHNKYVCLLSSYADSHPTSYIANDDDNLFIKIQPWNSWHLRTVNVTLWSRQCCDDSIPLLFWALCFYPISCQSDTVWAGRGGAGGILYFLATKTKNMTWLRF